MSKAEKSTAPLVIALADSGMNETLQDAFMKNYADGRKAQAKKILTEYRKDLLSDIHKSQDKLYLIGFIIQKWNLS